MSELSWLDPVSPAFPDTESALDNPNGLLAAGGNLSPETLIDAYSRGIFPWFTEGEPILWWTPSLRAVLFPEQLTISKGSRKQLRKLNYSLTTNCAFEEVIQACADQREESGTWITSDVVAAYIGLHERGIAQSVEVWDGEALVGGLYGIKLGSVFCGESMFNLRDSAAKLAFCSLASQLFAEGYKLIDCQIFNDFLGSLGVEEIPRSDFEQILTDTQNENPAWPEIWSSYEEQR